MHNKKTKQTVLKATIKQIIVAFIYVVLICSIVYIPFSGTINRAISLIDMISVETNKKILNDVKINLATKNLVSYPEYGSKYGTIKIPSLNVELPLYFGDTLSILRYGVGHSNLSYFPGEGGTVLCMGHNTFSMLASLHQIQKGAQIIIETTYGKYTFEVYETQIVGKSDIDKAPIQREKEILILYTCYPLNNMGHSTKRFLTYSNLVSEEVYEAE